MVESTSAQQNIGLRVKEIREWRRLTQEHVAGAAGIDRSYLSRIENGLNVDSRNLLDRLAAALQVAPSDLAGRSLEAQLADPEVGAAQATLAAVESALSDVGYGDVAVTPRPWPVVAADLARLNNELRPAADYAEQGQLLPTLILELQALVGDSEAPRTEVLTGLMDVYHTASVLAKNLGARGLPALAALHAHRAAEELDDPAALGLAAWLRGNSLGGGGRRRAVEIFTTGARDLQPHLSDPRAQQMYGALHLQAGLASAALRQPSDAEGHLTEAGEVARALGEPEQGQERGYGSLYFGTDNVGICHVSVATELGDHDRVREVGENVVLARVPSAARQAMYWADLGRGLAVKRETRADSVTALRRAEDIAPVRVRTHPLVRETVTSLLPRKLPNAVARELRGMAWRMGIAG